MNALEALDYAISVLQRRLAARRYQESAHTSAAERESSINQALAALQTLRRLRILIAGVEALQHDSEDQVQAQIRRELEETRNVLSRTRESA